MSIIDLNINNWQKYHSDIFGFSFNIPKEMKVVESKENKTASLIFMDFRVMLFDVEYIKKPVEVSDDVDWNRIKILESFVINGEPIDLIAHNQPELDDMWTFPSDCSYYVFKNHSDENKMFFIPSCTRNDYIKKIERKVVGSVIFD
jgi:hypothetical protein